VSIFLRWVIRSYSHAGDVVLDPFMGGGSCGRAAAFEQRRFIGMEADPVHFATAEPRIQAAYQSPDLH